MPIARVDVPWHVVRNVQRSPHKIGLSEESWTAVQDANYHPVHEARWFVSLDEGDHVGLIVDELIREFV